MLYSSISEFENRKDVNSTVFVKSVNLKILASLLLSGFINTLESYKEKNQCSIWNIGL